MPLRFLCGYHNDGMRTYSPLLPLRCRLYAEAAEAGRSNTQYMANLSAVGSKRTTVVAQTQSIRVPLTIFIVTNCTAGTSPSVTQRVPHAAPRTPQTSRSADCMLTQHTATSSGS